MYPAVNSFVGNSKYFLALFWNPLVSFNLKDESKILRKSSGEAVLSYWSDVILIVTVLHSDGFVVTKLSNSMENVRIDFAMETDTEGGSMAGIQTARGASAASTNPLNFSLKNLGTELK